MNRNYTLSRTIRRTTGGFSLVEMAIVLVIFALLAGGMILSLGAQREAQEINETRRQLSEIREALLGYAAATGRLPPPADPAKASNDPTAGLIEEGRVSGAVPWVTLGLSETDPWGQRFTYRVRLEFSDPVIPANQPPTCVPNPLPALAGFALCSEGNISVTDGAVIIANKLPAIVVSHGPNGLGGYRSDGTQVAGAAGDELENANNNVNFVSRNQSANFDDEVIWLPLFNLMSRMIAAGRLP